MSWLVSEKPPRVLRDAFLQDFLGVTPARAKTRAIKRATAQAALVPVKPRRDKRISVDAAREMVQQTRPDLLDEYDAIIRAYDPLGSRLRQPAIYIYEIRAHMDDGSNVTLGKFGRTINVNRRTGAHERDYGGKVEFVRLVTEVPCPPHLQTVAESHVRQYFGAAGQRVTAHLGGRRRLELFVPSDPIEDDATAVALIVSEYIRWATRERIDD